MVLERVKQTPGLGSRRSPRYAEVSMAFVTSRKSDFFSELQVFVAYSCNKKRSSPLEKRIVHMVCVANADIQSCSVQLLLHLIYLSQLTGHIL